MNDTFAFKLVIALLVKTHMFLQVFEKDCSVFTSEKASVKYVNFQGL